MTEPEEKEILIALGRRLQNLREEKSLSLRELAAIAGVEHALIHRIEKGQTNPQYLTLYRLAKGLGVNL